MMIFLWNRHIYINGNALDINIQTAKWISIINHGFIEIRVLLSQIELYNESRNIIMIVLYINVTL